MRRNDARMRRTISVLLVSLIIATVAGKRVNGQTTGGPDGAATISGVVKMPEICSPSISPAVVYLEQAGDPAESKAGVGDRSSSGTAEIALVNQRGLQFTPRVQATVVGQTVRFANQDGETHNVHVVSTGFAFNQSMAAGQHQDFTPEKPGVMILACDIHIHMRGFVVVSPTPWVQVCSAKGRFRLEGVPDGRYVLNVWHEMGDPLRKEITVEGGKAIDLHELVVEGRPAPAGATGVATATPRPWADVVDRIGMLLAASRQSATRSGEASRARRLAEDAYWAEFEASDMEVAVQRHLGVARASELETQFRKFRSEVRDVAERRRPVGELEQRSHDLLLDLVAAAGELNTKGVIDSVHVAATRDLPSRVDLTDLGGPPADVPTLLQGLRRGFHRVYEAADQHGPDEASSELTSVYMNDFEPIERYLLGRSPQSVRPLEIEFNAIRGAISTGLKGEALAARLDRLDATVGALTADVEARPVGVFGAAFSASLVTIVREGVEVILVLAMLIALVVKAAQPARTRPGPGRCGRSGPASRWRSSPAARRPWR